MTRVSGSSERRRRVIHKKSNIAEAYTQYNETSLLHIDTALVQDRQDLRSMAGIDKFVYRGGPKPPKTARTRGPRPKSALTYRARIGKGKKKRISSARPHRSEPERENITSGALKLADLNDTKRAEILSSEDEIRFLAAQLSRENIAHNGRIQPKAIRRNIQNWVNEARKTNDEILKLTIKERAVLADKKLAEPFPKRHSGTKEVAFDLDSPTSLSRSPPKGPRDPTMVAELKRRKKILQRQFAQQEEKRRMKEQKAATNSARRSQSHQSRTARLLAASKRRKEEAAQRLLRQKKETSELKEQYAAQYLEQLTEKLERQRQKEARKTARRRGRAAHTAYASAGARVVHTASAPDGDEKLDPTIKMDPTIKVDKTLAGQYNAKTTGQPSTALPKVQSNHEPTPDQAGAPPVQSTLAMSAAQGHERKVEPSTNERRRLEEGQGALDKSESGANADTMDKDEPTDHDNATDNPEPPRTLSASWKVNYNEPILVNLDR